MGLRPSGLLTLDWSPQWADSKVGLVRQWGRGCTQEDAKGPESLKTRTAWRLLLTAMDPEPTTRPASSSAGLECLTVDEIGEGILPCAAVITQFPGPVGPELALDYLPLITFPRGPTVCPL